MKMNKLMIPAAVAAVALSACSHTKNATENAPQVRMANPASVFCEQKGGKSEIRKNEDGSEYGVCHLPDGSVVEEWEYFRANHQ